MKKIVKSFILVAAAAMGFTACQKEIQEEVPADKGTVQVTFVADSPDTKTSVDTSDDETPFFSWDESETFAVLEQQNSDTPTKAGSVEYEKVDGKAKITATFGAGSYVKGGAIMYHYVTIYPASGYVGAESLAAATLSLPAVQTMAEGSYDPDADLMVSTILKKTEPPTEAQMVSFTRMAAVVKMTLKNFSLEAGDEVEQVIFTAEGKTLAGTITADLAKPNGFAAAEGVDNVTVNTTSSTDVYFTVLPTTLEAGDAYTVTILTNKKLYIKQGTIPAEKTLDFKKGMVTRLGVDMNGIAPSEKWVLVRDASTLEENDIVTIAAANNNFVLGCNSSDNFPYASYSTNVIKSGDYLYHPIVTDKSKSSYMIQPLVLSKQDADKAAFDFYNGVDYEGDTKTGYLTNYETLNYLKRSAYPSKNSAFEISISEGVATIEVKESEWKNTLLKFYNYNPNSTTSTYRRFVCTKAESIEANKHDDVCIYRLAGAKGVVPTAGAVVTVPDADEPLVVPVDGVAEETVFEGVKFTYVGDWNISVSDNAEWLTVNYADGALSYTAEANDGTVRYATVTITASLEGEESKTWTFPVVQKGAPVKATVEEFIEYAKTKDPNVEYEVTGILDTKASGASSKTYIVDAEGNEAAFKYIDMEDDTDFYKSTIAEGDIVTIVAAVVDVNVGGSSSAHAICKGYYNLSATVEEDLVEYDGGSVVVKLKKSGTLPHGVITCTDDADFAEVEYDPDTYEATVTLKANDGAPRQAVVTFKDDYAKTSVAIVQSADREKGNTWELVTDASTLAAGDQVIIAAKDYDVAMSPTIISNKGRSAVAVTKLGNYFLTPTADVQTLVLGKGSVDGTFAFYDDDNKGFLVSSSTSSSTYKLDNQAYIDANTSFAITIVDGIATIGNKEGTYSSCKFGYHASNKCFFSGTSTSQSKVCLYRLVGVEGTIPVIPADITVPTSEVAISEDATTSATPFAGVEFNYVGDWTISVSSSEDWLKVDYADGVLTYTAEANNSTKRSATVTITATLGNQTLEPWTFNVVQRGVPQDISIADFVKLIKDENSTYRITGQITETSISSEGTFKLTDGNGNVATVMYLYTDGGSQVSNDANIGVAVGDIMTVTTVPVGSGKGGNGSHHSIYKGHYGLSTVKGLAADYRGGTVEIDVATYSNGAITLPEAVEASIEDNDYAVLTYSDGKAVVTFATENETLDTREAVVTFTYGLIKVEVVAEQGVNPANRVGWNLVTDASTLAIGDEIIIVAMNSDKALGAQPSTVSASGIEGTSNFPAVDVDKSSGVVYDVEKAGALVFTLAAGNSEDTFALRFTHKDADYYLYAPSTGLKGRSVSSGTNSSSSYTIEIEHATGKATIKSGYPKLVMFNGSTGTTFLSVSTSSSNVSKAAYAVAIYKK